MITASKSTVSLNNLKILRPKVTKNYEFVYKRSFVNPHPELEFAIAIRCNYLIKEVQFNMVMSSIWLRKKNLKSIKLQPFSLSSLYCHIKFGWNACYSLLNSVKIELQPSVIFFETFECKNIHPWVGDLHH